MKYIIIFTKKILEFIIWISIIFSIGSLYNYYKTEKYADLEKKSISNILFYSKKEGFNLEKKEKSVRGGYTKYEFTFSKYNDAAFLSFINDLKHDNYLLINSHEYGFLCRNKESILIHRYPEIHKIILEWRYPDSPCPD